MVLVRRRQAGLGSIVGEGVATDGRLAVASRRPDGDGWLMIEGQRLERDGKEIFRASTPVDAARSSTASAGGLLTVQTRTAVQLSLTMPQRPKQVWRGAPDSLSSAEVVPFDWAGGTLGLTLPVGTWALLIDPSVAPVSRPAEISLAWRANETKGALPLEMATAENGDWIAAGTFEPKVAGYYRIHCVDAAAEILVQDHWDPERSSRGVGDVRTFVAPGAEVIVRFRPAAKLPALAAELVEAVVEVNLLRNGDCEAGLPGYPPRGWTVQDGEAGAVYREDGGQGWPGWTQESAASGQGALKFVRPLNRVTDWRPPHREFARNQMVAMAPPVRLREAGRHRLSWMSKGTATAARVVVEGADGKRHTRTLAPNVTWQRSELVVDLPAGLTQISVRFSEGGADDQVAWIDDVRLVSVAAQ